MMVNIFKQVEHLEKNGFSKDQAMASIQANLELMREESASKKDMAELRHELKHDMAELRHELKHDMAELRHELKQDMAELRYEFKQDLLSLENRLTIRTGVIVTAAQAVLFTLLQMTK